jgi:hypothetical protein
VSCYPFACPSQVVNLERKYIITTKKTNEQAPSHSNKKNGLQVNAEQIMCMFMFRHKNTGKNQVKGPKKCVKSGNVQIFGYDNKK